MLLDRIGDSHPGLRTREREWTWDEVVTESNRRGALAGATVVGINPTRDDDTVAAEIRQTDCRLIVADTHGAARLQRLDIGLPPDRVIDIENASTLVTERVLRRYPGILAAAAYAVPDPRSGDLLMAAIEVRDPACLDLEALAGYLSKQDDIGGKGIPRLLRISTLLPTTGSNKIMKHLLRQHRWDTDDPVHRWSGRPPVRYTPLTAADKRGLADEFAVHGREHLLVRPEVRRNG
ncbi:hypothetical protein ACFVUS_05505 [Nocardia sp. NPDC058058]|uniref:hypothetical protein n=1 Tax=Nocardia sp. NPDC058058 TaxID=3346317 RepID=UPI0036DAA3CC